MATILCVTSTVPGMLYPGVELTRRLARAGHHLTFASFADARRVVESQRLDFLQLPPSRSDAFLAVDREVGFFERLRHVSSRRQQALDSLAIDPLRQAVRRLDPDLILIDGEMHEQIIALAAGDVPIVLLNSFVSIWRRPGLPPPHHLACPGVGWKGSRVGMWWLWQLLRFKKRTRAWSLAVRRVGCDRLSLLRHLARDGGFDFRRETDDSQWLIPFTYRRLPVLSLHAREFEFPHRSPARVRYIGPLLLEERGDERSDEVHYQLEAIFERCSAGDRALIYAGFGSFFSTDPGLVRRLIGAVAERPDWELVISLAGRGAIAELDPLPENVHVFGWLPQLDVLRHADVAVTHGGINTIDECVLAGVPMLIYCGFETDMAGNTSRVVYYGLGIAGDRRDSPRTMRQRLEHLLREPRFMTNVERLRADYAAYAENQVAESAVESLLRPTPGSHR